MESESFSRGLVTVIREARSPLIADNEIALPTCDETWPRAAVVAALAES